MNLKIWSLTLFGVLIGLLTSFGIVQNYPLFIWIIIAVICGIVIAKSADTQLFVKGVVVGLFIGIFFVLIQYFMFDTYLLNNPNSLDGFKQITTNLAPQYVILFSGPFFGIGFGLLIGFFAFVFDKMTGKKIKQNNIE